MLLDLLYDGYDYFNRIQTMSHSICHNLFEFSPTPSAKKIEYFLCLNLFIYFRGISADEVEDNEKLRVHAQTLMRVFAMLTDSLEDNTSDTKEINDFLLMLGAKHASFNMQNEIQKK